MSRRSNPSTAGNAVHREPWNQGELVGQKAPFKLKDIWALRVRAVQRLLGHSKLESTVRYLGIEVDDALQIRYS